MLIHLLSQDAAVADKRSARLIGDVGQPTEPSELEGISNDVLKIFGLST